MVFYDRRNTTGTATKVYIARSDDGGESFENFQVSESEFTPQPNVFFGDYIDIDAMNGKIYPIWMRLDNTVLSVWAAIISEPLTGVEEQDSAMISDFGLRQNYPNPFNPTTSIEFFLPNASFVTLKIYNTLGEEVATLVSERLSAGKHRREWNASGMASGVYMYQIEAGEFADAKKLILLR